MSAYCLLLGREAALDPAQSRLAGHLRETEFATQEKRPRGLCGAGALGEVETRSLSAPSLQYRDRSFIGFPLPALHRRLLGWRLLRGCTPTIELRRVPGT